MEPVLKLIDKTEQVLGHSPHPAIVWLPLGSWVVSNICDVFGAITQRRNYDQTAHTCMGIGLLGAAGAIVTGLRDYSLIPPERPSHAVATRHGLGNALVGSLFAMSYVMRSRRAHSGRRPGLLARSLALTGGALGMYTAWLGGKLVEEYGEAVKPVMQQQTMQAGAAEHRFAGTNI